MKCRLDEVARPGVNPFKAVFRAIPALQKRAPPPRVIPSPLDAQQQADEIGETFLAINNDESIDSPEHESWYEAYLQSDISKQSSWRPCSEREVVSAIKRIQSKSAPGPDRLSGQLFKQLTRSPTITRFLHREANRTIETGHLPHRARERWIVPVPKGDGSFRPISLLTVYSKIIDRIIADRLKADFPIRQNQFGCKRGHSAQHALTRVLHYSAMAHEHEESFGLLALDFSKAYDRVNPFILLKKLADAKIDPVIIKYVHDWMTERSYRVLHQKFESKEFTPTNGLPQGSPLSVMLWLVFINDIDVDDNNSNIFMDDTALWASGSDEEIIQELGEKLRRIEQWCIKNHVRLNHTKSGWIANSHIPSSGTSLRLSSGKKIAQRSSLKYLGATFKSSRSSTVLCFDHSALVGKIRRCNGLLKRVRCHVSEYHLNLFAKALILGKLTFFLPMMGMESEALLKSLESGWRETLRIITGVIRSTPDGLVYGASKLPPLKFLIQEQAGRMWFKTQLDPLHPLRQDYYNWGGEGDGWTPLGAHWLADEYLRPSIEGIETLITPSPQELDCLYECSFKIASSKRRALEEQANNTLVPRNRDLYLWTDGSYKDSLGGAAVVISKDNISSIYECSQKFSNLRSAFDAELRALERALRELAEWIRRGDSPHIQQSSQVAILSDCKSLLMKLRTMCLEPKRVNSVWRSILGSVKFLYEFDVRIEFVWVPAHRGIGLNDRADILARQTLQGDSETRRIPTSSGHVNRLLRDRRSRAFAQWLNTNIRPSSWEHAPCREVFKTTRIGGTKSRLTGQRRHVSVQILRLRTGHTLLRHHFHRHDPREPLECRLCDDDPETAMHLLFECPRLSNELKELRTLYVIPPDKDKRFEFFNRFLLKRSSQPLLRQALRTLNDEQIFL